MMDPIKKHSVALVRPQCGKLTCSGKKVHRKITYRVGYTWNRGGRLKELRIRFLARKYFHLWIQKTFGRITTSQARSYYSNVVLRKVFRVWRDEWWHARKEWSLIIRADCHYKYVLYCKVYAAWCEYVSIRKEKQRRMELAFNVVEQCRLRAVWDCWELYVEMQRIKRKMHEEAVKYQRLALARQMWTMWQAALEHRKAEHLQANVALKHWEVSIKNRAWLQWTKRYLQTCSLKEKFARAHLHYSKKVCRRVLEGWITHTYHKQAKNQAKAVAVSVWHCSLVRRHWCVWLSALKCRQAERDRGEIADNLAQRTAQRQAFSCWKNYVQMCSEKAKKEQAAFQHHQIQLLRVGLKGLALNVAHCKSHRKNKNISNQHHQQTVMVRFWKHWQQRLEQIEEQSVQPQMTVAVNYHRYSVLRFYLQRWRDRCKEHKQMKHLELRADSCFAQRIHLQCLTAWVEFTNQRVEHRKRKERAEQFHQQQIYSWVFYTWWESCMQKKDQRLAERTAVLHAEQVCLSRTWCKWVCRALQQRQDRLKRIQAETHHRHIVLQKALHHWRHKVKTIQKSQRHFEQAAVHDGQRCMRGALIGWREYVGHSRQKSRRLMQIDGHYQRRLLNRMLQAWKQHHVQMQQIKQSIESRYQQHQQRLGRKMLCLWRRNVQLTVEERQNETMAKIHYQHSLLLKVLLAWHRWTDLAVSHHCQQEAALREAQIHMGRVRMRTVLKFWREQTCEVRTERLLVEKACTHHHNVLLKKSLSAWIVSNYQHKCYQAMKIRSTDLYRLRVCQRMFICWKAQLQSRRKEAEQTETALWHWALNLQAKVLCAWRHWVAERHRKEKRLVEASHFYRDELLREGITHILTHAAHMSALSTNIALSSHEQSSHRLHTVVRQCALRWKQRALCKTSRLQKSPINKVGPLKKNVSFFLPENHIHSLASDCTNHSVRSQTEEKRTDDSVLSKVLLVRASRLKPRRSDDLLYSPGKEQLLHSQTITNDHNVDGNVLTQISAAQKLLPDQTDTRLSSSPTTSVLTSAVPVPPPPTQPHPSVSILSARLQASIPVLNIRPGSVGNSTVLPSQDVLLPPSMFTADRSQMKMKHTNTGSVDAPLLSPVDFVFPNLLGQSVCERITIGEKVDDDDDDDDDQYLPLQACDPIEDLTKELEEIKLDLQRYQHDREQLQTWRKLQRVLRTWLQTTGNDEETEEREDIIEELNELQSCISKLSKKLTEHKPTMICHAARVSSIESQLLELNNKT